MADDVCGLTHDKYLPASFNGVPFYCKEATSEHGRRGAEGEFPFGETTGYADLGRRIRKYTLSAEFRSNNHILESAALIAVCELPGPGVLVHPTRGILNVACTSIHVSNNMVENIGITEVDLEFVEGNIWPNGLSLVGSVLGLALSGIIGSSSTSFKQRYRPKTVSPVRKPTVIDTAQTAVAKVGDSYERAIHTQSDTKKWRSLNELREVQYEDVLAADEKIMDEALVLSMGALSNEIEATKKYDTFKGFANWAAGVLTLLGWPGEVQDAVLSHVRIISAAYMAQAAVEIQYAKMDTALMHLDAIVLILREEAINARNRCDNALYLALSDFITNVQTILYHKSYKLPRLIVYDFHGGVHALVASYAIYNDAKKHRDLEQRNIIDANGYIGPHVIASMQQTARPVI